jgi:hypothetical protein
MTDEEPTTTKRPRSRPKAAAPVPERPSGDVEVIEPPARRPAVTGDGASLAADSVDVHMGAVGRVEAGEVSVTQGAVGAARTQQLTVDRGAVGAVLADRAELSRGYTRSILARQVQMDRAAARIVIAADVRAEQTAVMFLVARRVSGDIRVLFDWRGALAFGAAAGLLLGIFSRTRRQR